MKRKFLKIMTDDIKNYCAMCLLPKGDDSVSIFERTEKGVFLNKYGKMYEDFLSVKIDDDQNNFPKYICSSCSLQLQLSINLKHKALDSFNKINSSLEILNTVKKEEPEFKEYGIKLNEEKNCLIYYDDSNENRFIEMDFTELPKDKDEDSNQSYESNSNHQNDNYLEDNEEDDDDDNDDNTEFLDVQYLKDDYDDEFDNKSLIEYKTVTTINPNEFSDDENEEFISLNINENDLKEMIQTTLHDKNLSLKLNKKDNNLKLKDDNRLIKKVQNVKKRTKFLCDLCPKVSYSREAYEVHKKVHAGLPAFKCEICDKNFKQKVHYNIHMMNHTNERNFTCEECGKKFKTKSDLRIHFEIHTGERRYVCDICNKTYRAHSHMKNHRYTHFEKQLECQICKQKYISPATLKTHIKTIHEMVSPQHECMHCHKKFKRKHHLQVHLRTHNKNKNLDNINKTLLEVLEMTNYKQGIDEVFEEVET